MSIFQRPVWVAIFALTAAIAWGWAYPLIKLGFVEFGIIGPDRIVRFSPARLLKATVSIMTAL